MRLRDDVRGFAWLREHGLEDGKFICVIPRLRYTPYYKVNNVPRVPRMMSATPSTAEPRRRITPSFAR